MFWLATSYHMSVLANQALRPVAYMVSGDLLLCI